MTRRPVQTNLYVHVSLADLATHLTTGAPAVGEAEQLGPATVDLMRTWLNNSSSTIRPVLDLDHITPYDDTGPPGQTRPDNLASCQYVPSEWVNGQRQLSASPRVV